MTWPEPRVNSNGWLRGMLLSNSVPSSSVPWWPGDMRCEQAGREPGLPCSAWRACLHFSTSCRRSLASSSLRSSAPGPSPQPATAPPPPGGTPRPPSSWYTCELASFAHALLDVTTTLSSDPCELNGRPIAEHRATTVSENCSIHDSPLETEGSH